MAEANRDQIEFWSTTQGHKWLRLEDRIERMMTPFTEAGLAALGDIAGRHCLDIGCGAGGTTLALADAAGDGGSAAGIDVSPPLLKRAWERADGRENVCFAEGDAQDYAFRDETFDILFSRFGIMFFRDTPAALANLRRASRPGARLVFIVWREPRENPWVMIPVSAAKAFVELPPRPAPGEPSQFQWADADLATGWLEGAGWRGCRFAPLDIALAMPGGPLEASRFLLQMGPGAALLAEAGGDLAERAEAALAEDLVPHLRNGAVILDSACWIVSATAA
ncbi:MAG: class I SAM-dependent methyltransferase [Rhodospirillaceae bacterium]|nr:class I SAM-dependent methyltransferase [Rhodospirillaceae bacterium]MYH38995.1 class I SAM-dependent methyltransferase [Rhodospirillaceae bacterium]MYK16170.1 class I SAM-dependent methyltransferase [Rhodospirillaceae bacterium]MYK60093.1 class I SAM-dependent methyltransferase [Rhodospirillaceae bacterium]